MRIVFLIAGICALAVTNPIENSYNIADESFLERQEAVFQLFKYVNHPNLSPEFVTVGNAMKFEGHWDQWSKPEYAKEFYHYFKHGNLPRGEVFSVFNPEQLKQAASLFRTFYYAKDYETFYKAAVWARRYVNEGMFVYALSIAIFHSKHTTGLVLPPIHEIMPHYFFNDDVISKTQQYKKHYRETDPGCKGYTTHANYSDQPEQSITYFTEDVGLNSFYYYEHIISPFWMLKRELLYDCAFRGEYFYYYNQKLLARYYLERLSNGLGEIPLFEYGQPIPQFHSFLQYPNGLHFPDRPNNLNFYDLNYTHILTHVNDYERRLRDAVDMGFFFTPSGQTVSLLHRGGFNKLGMLIEGNIVSPNSRFYGDILSRSRQLLGHQRKLVPSALEHYETSARDPMFYQMIKRTMHYFYQHQNYEGPYRKEELHWAAVKIEDVEVDPLVTFFDQHYSDLTNAVEFQDDCFRIRASQYRLNHKPFNYTLYVNSEVTTEAFVKVFIGPNLDEHGRAIAIEDSRLNFFEIERFPYSLQTGKNVIERNPDESIYLAVDRTGYIQPQEQVRTAMEGGEELKYFPPGYYFGFPRRFLLPKGASDGKCYQFYVIVTPYHTPVERTPASDFLVDVEYSLSFPFDRPIEFKDDFFVQNSYIKDILIYHENVASATNETTTV